MSTSYLPRYAAAMLGRIATLYPVVLISGARQTGKTTLARQQFPNHRWVLLDAAAVVDQARSDPGLFLTNHPPPVIFDEVQRVPELFREIKSRIDTTDFPSGSIILTGSQPIQLMQSVSESLAGRVGLLSLAPLTIAERTSVPFRSFFDMIDNPPIGERSRITETPASCMFRGGLPAVWLPNRTPTEEDVRIRLSDYISTYVSRDLRDIGGVKDLGRFERLVRLLATATATVPNLTELAGNGGIPQSTAHEWMNILQSSELLIELPAYHTNAVKRESRRPKWFFADSGLATNLLGYTTSAQLDIAPYTGRIFETMVLQCIRTRLRLEQGPAQISCWRSHERDEVDMVIERTSGELIPVEIKLSSHTRSDDCRGLRAFMRTYPETKQALLVTAGDQCVTLGNGILHVPMWWV